MNKLKNRDLTRMNIHAFMCIIIVLEIYQLSGEDYFSEMKTKVAPPKCLWMKNMRLAGKNGLLKIDY